MANNMFTRIDAPQAYRLVFEAVEKRIMNGQLKLGDPLPSETKLAEQFGINRSTVREGIRLLEESGLVRRKTPKRLEVAAPHMSDLATRATRALKLNEVSFRDLWEVSIAIEPIAARIAAERITNSELEALATNLSKMEQHVHDTAAVIELDIEFHNIIARSAKNCALDLVRETIGLLFMPAGQVILPRLHTEKRIVDAHRLILTALTDHQPAMAESWMKKHIEDFLRGFERTGLSIDEPLFRLIPKAG